MLEMTMIRNGEDVFEQRPQIQIENEKGPDHVMEFERKYFDRGVDVNKYHRCPQGGNPMFDLIVDASNCHGDKRQAHIDYAIDCYSAHHVVRVMARFRAFQ